MKKKYEAPQTRSIEVELESGFMTGSQGTNIDGEESSDITISEQTPGVAIGNGGSESGFDNQWGSGWDE